MAEVDARRFAPATQRNRAPILAVLERVLPARGLVLEIASGTGEHAVAFASALSGLVFQPSDVDPDALASIAAWRRHAGLPNLREPLVLDVHARPWPLPAAPDAVLCSNLIHIAPWSACLALFAGAAAALAPGAPLVLYGPYREGGEHTAPSNAAFDASLRERDASFGVRNLEDVAAEAAVRGFALEEVVAMPANNRTVVLRRLRG
jgi:SAM-dependent methyltransferase